MSDALPIDEVKAEYIRLRASGAEPALAMEQAKAAVQSRLDAKPGKGMSFVRGAAQGGSLGFGDEIAGALGAAASSLGILPNHEKLGFGDAYRQYRDEARAADSEAQTENPKTFIAGQFAGGAATAPALPLGGAATTAARAAGVGALYGAAGGLGASRADLTEGDAAGAARDAAIGAGIGAATGVVIHGATKGAKSLWRRFVPDDAANAAERAAASAQGASAPPGGSVATTSETKLSGKALRAAADEARTAAESMDRPSSIGAGQSVAKTAEESRNLVRWAKAQGEDLHLFPDQETGTRSAALARRRASQFDPTMDRMQALEAEQGRVGTRLLNKLVDHMAADPSRLGTEDMARSVGDALKAEARALYSARSAAAGPIYDAAERAGGGVDARGIIAAVRGEISPFQSGGVSKQLSGILRSLEDMGAGGGLSIKEANGLRKLMGDVIRGEGSFLDGIDMDVQGKIARRILSSVDDAFDQAAGTDSARGVELLRQANATWRSHSQKIDETMTDTVMSIIRKSGGDASESIPSKLLKMEPGQVRSVFKIVRKQSPGDASDLLASMLEDALVAGGKPSRGAIVAEQKGVQRLGAQGAIKALEKIEPLMHAAQPDNKARFAVSRAYDLLDRLRHGPNITGSDTAPKAFAPVKTAIGMVSDTAAKAMESASALADKITGSNKAIAEALSTRQGLEAFNAALEVLLAQKQQRPISQSVVRKLTDAAGRAGLLATPRVASMVGVDTIGLRQSPGEPEQRMARPYSREEN